MEGGIACRGNIIVTVEKYLKILSGDGVIAIVETFRYSYNVSVRNEGNIFRYDNSHDRPGHTDRHHKHEFDDEGETITWIGSDEAEQETIALIHRHRRSGKSSQKIADYLNAQSIPTKRGGTWHHSTVRKVLGR